VGVVVGQERNNAVCERLAMVGSNSVGAEFALETNCVISGGDKIVASDV
jgi:hypothetical protein